MKLKLYLFLVLVLIPAFAAISQDDNISFETISIADGLSQSSVYSIVQDNKGFLWFGTLDGLNKYDGYKITKYRNDPRDIFSIADNSINCIFQDSEGTLWIGTRGVGICKYDKIKNRFSTISHNPDNSNSLSNNYVTSIFQDENYILWIGTQNGLNRFDYKKKAFTRLFVDDNNVADNNYVTSITSELGYGLWIGTKNGVHHFDIASNKFDQHYQIGDNNNLGSNIINALLVDREKRLWVATSYGLYRSNERVTQKKSLSFKTFVNNPKNLNSLSSNTVTSLIKDASGIIWVGTEKGGLNKYDALKQEFTVYRQDPTTPNSLSSNNILTLYIDRTNIMWIGTYLGGINKWNRSNNAMKVYRHNPFSPTSLSSSQVRSIYEDKTGTIWIGTVDNGLNKWDRRNNTFIHYPAKTEKRLGLNNPHIRCMLEDTRNNFWIGTDGGGLHLMNRNSGTYKLYTHDPNNPNSLSSNNIWDIYEDKIGNLWIATMGNGLNKFDYKTQSFTTYKADYSTLNTLSSNEITTVYEDSNGTLWVGTMGGLNRLIAQEDGKPLIFKSYKSDKTDHTSLGNDRVYSIIEDCDSTLWIGTKGSLNRYNKATETFKKYAENEGFPNDVIMGIADDEKGFLWISTNSGLSRFSKKNGEIRNFGVKDGIQSNEFLVGSFFKSKSGEIFFGGIDGFNVFSPKNLTDNPYRPPIIITGFQIFNRDVDLDTNIIEKKHINLAYHQNVFSFDFVSLNYVFPEKNQYAYIMEGFDKEWIEYGNKRYVSYTNLPPGEYVFRVKGSNNDGVWNNKGTSVAITIEPPFWKTMWFYIVVVLSIISLLLFSIHYRERMLLREKKRLAAMVKERTAEIVKQKEAIEQKNKELEFQKQEIGLQRDRIEQTYLNVKILSEVGVKATAQLQHENIIASVYNHINKLLDVPVYAIGIFNKRRNSIDFMGAKTKNSKLSYFSHSLDDQAYLSTYCFNNQLGMLIKDLDIERHLYASEGKVKLFAEEAKSLVYLPLIVKEKRIGVLTVQSVKKGFFTEYHYDILKNLAVYISIALDNANAYAQIATQKEEITLQRDKIKKRNADLKLANDKIQESSRMKEIFLANMSHEIRTPLNAINGYTNLLLNTELHGKQYQYLNNVKISANNLLVLINDILDFSKIEAGKLTIEHIEFDFYENMINFLNSIGIKATEKEIELQKFIDYNIPQYLIGDPYRLNQILTNLVGNGIKFTNRGGYVRVESRLVETQENQVILQFSVVDSGIGIRKEKLPVIFNSFTQASDDTARLYGGTGLGLAIVKQLVGLLGGEIAVDSEVDHGTKFSFNLTFEKGEGKAIQRKADLYRISQTTDMKGVRILLVEDNLLNQEIAVDTINLYNDQIIVDCAENGRIAVEKIESNEYDIIIMDIQMPIMDGVEATRYIRTIMKAPKNRIPILGMSAHALKSEKDKCIDAGMNDYITKPFEPENLFSKIHTLIGKSQYTNAQQSDNATESSKNEAYKWIDLSYLPNTYNKSTERKKKILLMCLENIPKDLETIGQHYSSSNWKLLSNVAHSLKSLVFYLGLLNLRELLETIEKNSKFGVNLDDIPAMLDNVITTWNEASKELQTIVAEL